jgi:hypothetical protein
LMYYFHFRGVYYNCSVGYVYLNWLIQSELKVPVFLCSCILLAQLFMFFLKLCEFDKIRILQL